MLYEMLWYFADTSRCVKIQKSLGRFKYLYYICSVYKLIQVMLGIKNKEEILTGKNVDVLYEEYKKRYGEPSVKSIA